MRALIIGMILFLSACNGSDKTVQVPYSDPALVAKVDALTKSLAETKASADKANASLEKIQLLASINSTSNLMFRSVLNAISFGPCDDGGIKVGSTVKAGGSGMDEQTQVFKQTATATCPGINAEYDVLTGNLHTANRVYFSSPDCSGNPLVWDAGGQGYDNQKLTEGVSFINPMDGLQYWVAPNDGNVPIIQAQSDFIVDNGDCEPDGDLQPMWEAVRTDFSVSGVPLSLGAAYHLSGF